MTAPNNALGWKIAAGALGLLNVASVSLVGFSVGTMLDMRDRILTIETSLPTAVAKRYTSDDAARDRKENNRRLCDIEGEVFSRARGDCK